MIARAFVLALCVAAASLAGLPHAAAQDNEREAALKAAFLYNFAKFTEWPKERSDADNGPVVI